MNQNCFSWKVRFGSHFWHKAKCQDNIVIFVIGQRLFWNMWRLVWIEDGFRWILDICMNLDSRIQIICNKKCLSENSIWDMRVVCFWNWNRCNVIAEKRRKRAEEFFFAKRTTNTKRAGRWAVQLGGGGGGRQCVGSCEAFYLVVEGIERGDTDEDVCERV